MISFIVCSLIILSIALYGIFNTDNLILILIYLKMILGSIFILLIGVVNQSVPLHSSNIMTLFPLISSALFILGVAVSWHFFRRFKNLDSATGSDHLC